LNLYADVGDCPIAELNAPALLAALRKIEARGAHELRERVQQRASMIIRYAIATGRCERDPVADLRCALTSPARSITTRHSEKELPYFLEKLDAYDGEPITKLAIRLLALTFVRTGELRASEWSEFDTDTAVWRIPAERMKMREPHIVPLSAQALAILAELKTLTGAGRLVFPHRTNPNKCMSENTVLYAL
jgi:integrase